MNMLVQNRFTNSSHYYERQAEMLVLEGYRHWSAGFETGSVIPWEMAWTTYSQQLGLGAAKRAITELSHFIRSLHFCSLCQLKAFPFGSTHICRDECLLLALVSALQNSDDYSADSCLEAMVSPNRLSEVKTAARDYAQVMSELKQILLPIPHQAIASIISPHHSHSFH